MNDDLFEKVAEMEIGDKVVIVGTFHKHPALFSTGWYLDSVNPTEKGAMISPSFVVGYNNIEKVKTDGSIPEKSLNGLRRVMFTMDPFVVNLAGSGGKRFLKMTAILELSNPEVKTEIQENLQKISDSITVLLSSKSFEDIYSVQGKFKLKNEIATRVNQILTNDHVKDVYFSEFIIQ